MMTDYSDCAMPPAGDDFTIKLGGMISLGYDSDKKLGLDDYLLFDDDYRDTLNHKIVAHYALREIGFDTPERFVFVLRRKMHEIMPYYNDLYKSCQLKFDPMSTVSLKTLSDNDTKSQASGKTTSDTTSQSDTKGSNDSHNRQRQVDSTTPDAALSNTGDYASQVSDVDATSHASSDAQVTASSHDVNSTDFSSSQSNGKGSTQSDGYSGIASTDLLQKYRDSIINVDMMIINELGELFMSVADTMDNMTPRGYRGLIW